eukprot:gene26719-4289_t
MKKAVKKQRHHRVTRKASSTTTTCNQCGATLNIPPSDEYNLQQHIKSDSFLKKVAPKVPTAVETPKTTCNFCGTLLLIPPSDLFNLRWHQESTSCSKNPAPPGAEPTTTCNLCGTLLQIPTSDLHNLKQHQVSPACRDARPSGRSITDFFSKNPGPILSPDVVFVSPTNSSEGPSTALPRLRSGALASPQPRLTGSSLESPSRKRASLTLGTPEPPELLNLHKVASRGRSRIETFDRLIVALSDKNVPRLRQLVQVALRQGRGPNFIIEQVSKAAQGVYHAKGWKDDPDAIDLAFLVLKIGGPLLLTAVHKATQNLPCVNWVKANGSPPKFAPYYGIDMEGVVK